MFNPKEKVYIVGFYVPRSWTEDQTSRHNLTTEKVGDFCLGDWLFLLHLYFYFGNELRVCQMYPATFKVIKNVKRDFIFYLQECCWC